MSLKSTVIFENSESIASVDKLNNEVEKLNECIQLERRKYQEYSIIRDVAMSCTTEESGLPSELQSKILDILSAVEVEDCLELASNDTLLGLAPLNIQLRYEEKEQIRNTVQQGIMNKSRKLFQELDELGIDYSNENSDTHSVLGISVDDKILVDYKKELNDKQSLYASQLQELISVLKEIIELKLKTLPESTNKKIHACEVQLQLFQLQSQVMDAKTRVDIFTETSQSMEAYRQLLKDIYKQQEDCKREIQQLRELKERYEQVSCKQYNELLQSYIKYKTIIESKKNFLNRLSEK
ncbi:hypothetical protein PPYR_10636 [Photinus pyralis]|uniref:Uncharacterized protein n=1 Tax=Photinus pyralis TaxID=7054 RepID=A0A1Y1L0R5_PHOPY|nr:uncharacterized protein LOC116174911 [Photinus pyralis]KAB0796575.1 hypothetical protein PPYR_10636 [Photinus pyralis]